MIVISRNGTTTVYTGWRAWLIAALLAIAIFGGLVLICVFLLGFALTLSVVLLLIVPAVVIAGLIAAAVRG